MFDVSSMKPARSCKSGLAESQQTAASLQPFDCQLKLMWSCALLPQGTHSRQTSLAQMAHVSEVSLLHEWCLTKLIGEPEVVCEEVGHVVVQPLQHVQGIVNEEDGVVVAIQHPLEVIVVKVGSQKGGHPCPGRRVKIWGQ